MKSNEQDNGTQSAHWSMKICFWVALIIVLVTSAVVILLTHRPVWIKLEILALSSGLLMTFFYSYILYFGVKFHDDGAITLPKVFENRPQPKFSNLIDLDYGDIFSGSEGIIGFVISVILNILFSLLLAFLMALLLWLGINLVVVSVVIITFPLFYIFTRSIKFVLRHAVECQGQFLKSILYGFGYALLKTATLCFIIFTTHYLVTFVKV
jgi:hypothetical protein